jgi:hypothetical protein
VVVTELLTIPVDLLVERLEEQDQVTVVVGAQAVEVFSQMVVQEGQMEMDKLDLLDLVVAVVAVPVLVVVLPVALVVQVVLSFIMIRNKGIT